MEDETLSLLSGGVLVGFLVGGGGPGGIVSGG